MDGEGRGLGQRYLGILDWVQGEYSLWPGQKY